jgi:hypothetical protein
MDKTFKEKYDTFKYNYYVSLNSPKKQYTSFLNSLYFISSRIPA